MTDKIEKIIVKDIEKFGWTIINVLPESKEVPFSYTIGLFRSFCHPEIAITGVKSEIADAILNNIGNNIKNGNVYVIEKVYDDILEGYQCIFKNISQELRQLYFGKAEWFYKNTGYNMNQIVLPDKNSLFPWDKGYTFLTQKLFFNN